MSDNVTPANVDTCLVEFNKKEYAIVGDALFANTVEEVPQWFQNLIQDKVLQVNGPMYDILTQYNLSLLAALQGLDIAKNTYEQYIYKVLTDSEAYVASLTTLNSTIAGNDASIRQLLSTYATKDFAVATAAQLLTASLNGGAIGAKVSSVESAMATQYGAMAQRLQILEAEYTNSISDLYGKAQAMEAVEAFVGANNDGSTTSLAYKVNKLSSYITDTTTGEVFGGVDQNLGGYTEVTAKNAADTAVVDIYSKYSKIYVGGKEYINGFGLFANYNGTTGGRSTFWAAADQFKLYDASTLDSTKIQTRTVFTNDGNPIEVVTGITGGVTPFRVENGVTYLQNAVIGWDAVTGSTKPQDGATRNVNRGTWASGIAYVVGDIVQHNGSSYTNKIATSSVNPTNTSYWTLLASQGPTGAAGPAGATGPQGSTGSRGPGFGSSSAQSPTDSAFTNATGLSSAIDGDQLLLTNSSGSHFYKRSGGIWYSNTALQVNGNAIINGMAVVNGALLAGSELRSSVYSAGTKGWRIDANGNAEFNAIDVRVPISNVIGQITKGNMQNVSGLLPYGRNGATPWIIPGSLTVSPPVTGKNYSILVYASMNGTWGSKDKDMSVVLQLNGQTIASGAGAGAWGINVTAMGLFSGRSGNAELTIHITGYNIDGTFTGQFGYIVFPE